MQEELFIAANNQPHSFLISKTSNCSFIPHVHTQPELIYLLNGKLTITVNGEAHLLEEGDSCLISAGRLHTAEMLSPSQCICCTFDAGEGFPSFTEWKQTDCIHACGSSFSGTVRPVVQALMQEWNGARNPLAVSGYLQILLARIFELGVPQSARQFLHPTTLRVISYLCEHFLDPITLESVAKEIGISKHHLSRLCNNEIGYGFNAYINYLRMTVARKLLIQTPLPIGEIAVQCGCGSLRTFNRTFFENTGMSPREFRHNPSAALCRI